MTTILKKHQRNGRAIRGGMTWREAKSAPATTFVIANVRHGHSPSMYTSKSKRGECVREGCTNGRRHGSAYCSSCSDIHNRNI